MALAKHAEEIAERRARNNARVIFEYQYPHGNALPAAKAAPSVQPDEKIIALREWVHRAIRESNERLAREMVALYRLDEQHSELVPVGYMTKGEAAKVARRVVPGELLDLDTYYGGMFVRAGYLFVSEATLLRAIDQYGDDPIGGLIAEKMAA
jgi:hypothetical protein